MPAETPATPRRGPVARWQQRHRRPANFWLHVLLGLPACFVAAPVLLALRQWWPAAGLFVGGYLVQFLGHAIEGNRSGEEMLLRRLLGKP